MLERESTSSINNTTMVTLRNLPALVRKQFKLAQETGDLTFYATRVSILQCEGLPASIIKLLACYWLTCNNSSKSDSLLPLQTSPNTPSLPARSQLIRLRIPRKVSLSLIYRRPTSFSSTNIPSFQTTLYLQQRNTSRRQICWR